MNNELTETQEECGYACEGDMTVCECLRTVK